jgi:Cro/C1-type HTH DNA-binding domain
LKLRYTSTRICSALDCKPGDLLIYEEDEEDMAIKNLAKSKEKRGKKGKGKS